MNLIIASSKLKNVIDEKRSRKLIFLLKDLNLGIFKQIKFRIEYILST